jgi:DNA-binding XRE family transcriptional regulator
MVAGMDNQDVVELLRKRLDIKSQTEIAKEIDVTPQFIYDVLRGARQPSDKILAYLGLERKIVKVR